jgi:hypothetical protein
MVPKDHDVPSSVRPRSVIQIGMPPCRMNLTPSRGIARGHWYHDLLERTSSAENGSTATNSILMAHWNGEKLAGSFAGSINDLGLILIKPSRLW